MATKAVKEEAAKTRAALADAYMLMVGASENPEWTVFCTGCKKEVVKETICSANEIVRMKNEVQNRTICPNQEKGLHHFAIFDKDKLVTTMR